MGKVKRAVPRVLERAHLTEIHQGKLEPGDMNVLPIGIATGNQKKKEGHMDLPSCHLRKKSDIDYRLEY